MPSRRSGARAAARASLGIDGALALLRSHPFAHSLHVVVPSLTQEKQRKGGALDNDNGAGGVSDVAPPPPPSLFDLLPPHLCFNLFSTPSTTNAAAGSTSISTSRPRFDAPTSPLSLFHSHHRNQHQGIFEAFFSFISRGVFTAVDVNNDGRIEDTEVEVAILKVREDLEKRRVATSTLDC